MVLPRFRMPVVLLFLLGILAGCTDGLTPASDLDRRAPIVFAVEANGCELSPGGRFMSVAAEPVAINGGTFYDTATGNTRQIIYPFDAATVQDAVSLYDEVLFVTTNGERRTDPATSGNYVIPANGWLVDVEHAVITDVLTLPSAERDATLAFAAEQSRTWVDRAWQARIAPNGKFIAGLGIINEYNATRRPPEGAEHTSVTVAKSVDCWFGWKPDSSGFYFVELKRDGLMRTKPGPVRLLLVDPPK